MIAVLPIMPDSIAQLSSAADAEQTSSLTTLTLSVQLHDVNHAAEGRSGQDEAAVGKTQQLLQAWRPRTIEQLAYPGLHSNKYVSNEAGLSVCINDCR